MLIPTVAITIPASAVIRNNPKNESCFMKAAIAFNTSAKSSPQAKT